MIDHGHLGAAMLMLGMITPRNSSIADEVPPEIAVADETVVLQAHVVGAQIYECKKGEKDALNWVFREPIATLVENGKTIGRHYAGPKWQVSNSILIGEVIGHAPGATDRDVPWLKLQMVDSLGDIDGRWRT